MIPPVCWSVCTVDAAGQPEVYPIHHSDVVISRGVRMIWG